ncbi:hypothetical protein RRG08_028866 [Elysia crispata]|uniref:Uncharacterized protein n=1 Tax=Elysia crispata TaxID=231223 RepID=A0AAE0YZ46_9GAST|nr:hypothetical protein RRG08_028866 [Elysia crispata]
MLQGTERNDSVGIKGKNPELFSRQSKVGRQGKKNCGRREDIWVKGCRHETGAVGGAVLSFVCCFFSALACLCLMAKGTSEEKDVKGQPGPTFSGNPLTSDGRQHRQQKLSARAKREES